MKKILSIILAVVMLLGCMSITAFAEEPKADLWEIQGDTIVKRTASMADRNNYTIPDGIKGFGNGEIGVFEGRDEIYMIRYLKFPASITTIAENALDFKYDPYYGYETVPISVICVEWTKSEDIPTCPYMNSDVTPILAVPNGTEDLYRSKAGWNQLDIRPIWNVNEQGELENYYDPGIWDKGDVLVFPENLGVRKIKYMALSDQFGYAKIIIPEGVVETERGIMGWNDWVVSVVLPKSLTTIAKMTLGYVDYIKEITVSWDTADSIATPENNLLHAANYGSETQWAAGITLYVPYGTKALYEAHPYWSQFGNIVELAHIHDFTGEYKDNGDGTHSQQCTICDEYDTPKAHTFTNGVCVCGAMDPVVLKNTAMTELTSLLNAAKCDEAKVILNQALTALETAETTDEISGIYFMAKSQAEEKDNEYFGKQFSYKMALNNILQSNPNISDNLKDEIEGIVSDLEDATSIQRLDELFLANINRLNLEVEKDNAKRTIDEVAAESFRMSAEQIAAEYKARIDASASSEEVSNNLNECLAMLQDELAAYKEAMHSYGNVILQSDDYSDAYKAIVREALTALDTLTSMDEVPAFYEEYASKLQLQEEKDEYSKNLLKDAETSEHENAAEIAQRGIEAIQSATSIDEAKEIYISYYKLLQNSIFKFDSKSLTLESALAFKFYGYLYDETPADDAYMEFKIGNIRTVKAALRDATVDNRGRYVFTCYLNILEVDEKIEAIFHDGEETVERRNPLSVTDYLDLVFANHQSGSDEDEKTVNLINAISNYAHYAQLALDETHTEYEVGNGGKYVGTAARTDITLHTADELEQFAATKTVADGFTDIKSTSRSLVLDDETAIVVYITPANADYIPKVKVTDKNGNDVNFTCDKQENGKYKVVIRGIAAHMLADTYTVDIDNGKLTYTNLSALSYAYSIISSGKSEAYKMAVSVLYDYYTATIAYMK